MAAHFVAGRARPALGFAPPRRLLGAAAFRKAGPPIQGMALSSVYLIADQRERAVIPFLDDALQAHAYVVKTINSGDYLVCTRGPGGPRVLAVIERKSLEDYAASFKDGRHANMEKLYALRSRSGCQVFLILEGPAFPVQQHQHLGD